MFWLLVAIAVVTLPLACSSSSSTPEDAGPMTNAG
jgi:hypothetical protein